MNLSPIANLSLIKSPASMGDKELDDSGPGNGAKKFGYSFVRVWFILHGLRG